jgi:hypothetical protein
MLGELEKGKVSREVRFVFMKRRMFHVPRILKISEISKRLESFDARQPSLVFNIRLHCCSDLG